MTLVNHSTRLGFVVMRIGQVVCFWNGLADVVCAALLMTLPVYTTSHVLYCNRSTACGRTFVYWTVCSGTVKCMGGLQTVRSRRVPTVAVLVLEGFIYWRESQAVLGPVDTEHQYLLALAFGSMSTAALVALLD